MCFGFVFVYLCICEFGPKYQKPKKCVFKVDFFTSLKNFGQDPGPVLNRFLSQLFKNGAKNWFIKADD